MPSQFTAAGFLLWRTRRKVAARGPFIARACDLLGGLETEIAKPPKEPRRRCFRYPGLFGNMRRRLENERVRIFEEQVGEVAFPPSQIVIGFENPLGERPIVHRGRAVFSEM